MDTTAVRQYVTKMQDAYEQVSDYRCIFKKQERVGGNLLPQETILLKFKKPFSIYMKWIKEPHKGQEIIYVRGWNDNELRAHPGSFPDLTVNLDPNGLLAMRDERHPVTEAGIGYTIKLVTDDFNYAVKHPQDGVKYYNRGLKKVSGRTTRCFEALMPIRSDSAYYAHRAVVYMDTTLALPARVTIYNNSNLLIEDYIYADIHLNVGLTKEDFNPDNPKYDF